MTAFRRLPVALLFALVGTLVLGLVGAGPLAWAGVDLATAEKELSLFEDHLKSSRSSNDDLLASLGAVAQAYKDLEGPAAPQLQEVPEGAGDEEREAIEKANKKLQDQFESEKGKFDRNAEKWRKDAEKAFLKALQLEKLNRATNTNIRMDVNIQAARVLGDTGNPDVSNDIQAVLERKVFKAKYDVPMLFLEEVFAALGKLNDHKTLEWMAKEFIHTNNSPREKVDQLIAAHKAMVLFKDVEGKLRHQIVKDMVKLYASTESQAMQSSNDPKIQATKQFWDRIKNDTIRAVQYYAGEPTKDDGTVLATMEEFLEWWREHDNLRKAPWLDAKE